MIRMQIGKNMNKINVRLEEEDVARDSILKIKIYLSLFYCNQVAARFFYYSLWVSTKCNQRFKLKSYFNIW